MTHTYRYDTDHETYGGFYPTKDCCDVITFFHSEIYVKDGVVVMRLATIDQGKVKETETDIEYCPFCGEKLVVEYD